MTVELVGEYVGLTPRLKMIVDEALQGAPPAIKKQYEVTRGFIPRTILKETPLAYWRVNSIYWEDGKIEINLVRSFDRVDDEIGQRKFADETYCVSVPLVEIIPFTLHQAAGLGANVNRSFSIRYKVLIVPDVWWGVLEDMDEVRVRFPHLRG